MLETDERCDTDAKGPHRTPVAAHLTGVLFEDGTDDVHTRWREAVRDPLFRHPEGAGTGERWQLAYDRLRLLNRSAAAPRALADDPRALAALHEWTAIVDGATSTVAGIHYNLFLGSLLDDRVSPARDLDRFLTMERFGTFLCTERGHGNDASALETTARLDPATGGFTLHTPGRPAQKYMPNTGPAGGAKSALVAARLLVDGRDEGVFLFLADLTDERGRPLPGVTVEPLPQRTGSPVDHCVTGFDHVALERSALVQGPHGRLLPDGSLASALGSPRRRVLHSIGRVTTGKLCMSAATLGGSRAALAVAVRYSLTRHVSGPAKGSRVPLAAHRGHYARLVGHLADAYAMTFLHRSVTDRWARRTPGDERAAERHVAVAKGWITWRARGITIECRERCGARGLFPVNGLAEYPANADGAVTAEGDNLAVWSKAAAEMLFDGPDTGPALPGGRPDADDPRFWRSLLAAAEGFWRERARQDLRRPGAADALGRWNNACDAALELVSAHAEGLAADAFTTALARDGIPDAARAVLEDLLRLFLVRMVRPRAGLLLAEGWLTAEQVLAMPERERVLVGRLGQYQDALVEAFAVPDEHLDALPMLTTDH